MSTNKIGSQIHKEIFEAGLNLAEAENGWRDEGTKWKLRAHAGLHLFAIATIVFASSATFLFPKSKDKS